MATTSASSRCVARHLAHPAPVVRAHAVWAARRLGLERLLGPRRADPDPLVQTELAREHGTETLGTDAPPRGGDA